ncbi:MAG: hypothetical protein MK212_09705 [Saprospiraceae bacterium]|nr:hypothetical protein [Saprospiraceae bacterium]
MKFLFQLITLGILMFSCSNGAEKSASPNTLETEGAAMGEDICACYAEMAETVRRSKLGEHQNLTEEEKAAFLDKIEDLSKEAKSCFRALKERYQIAEKKSEMTDSRKRAFEEDIAASIEANCPDVAEMLVQ